MSYQLTPAQKRVILKRDGETYQYCGKPATGIDHVIPYNETEDSTPENVVTCCPSCNKYGNNKVFDSFEEKRAYILGRRNSGRGRKRVLDPETVDAIFAQTDRPKRQAPYDAKYKRHTYRLKPETHAALKQVAAQYDVGINDLVRWVLRRFIEEHKAGNIQMPVQEYVVTRLRLSD
jgi:hypothetical protein